MLVQLLNRRQRLAAFSRGMNDREVAQSIGVKPPALSNWKNEKERKPTLSSAAVQRLAKALGIPKYAEWLHTGSGSPPREVGIQGTILQFLFAVGQATKAQLKESDVPWQIWCGVPHPDISPEQWLSMATKLGMPSPTNFKPAYERLIVEIQRPLEVRLSYVQQLELYERVKPQRSHSAFKTASTPRWLMDSLPALATLRDELNQPFSGESELLGQQNRASLALALDPVAFSWAKFDPSDDDPKTALPRGNTKQCSDALVHQLAKMSRTLRADRLREHALAIISDPHALPSERQLAMVRWFSELKKEPSFRIPKNVDPHLVDVIDNAEKWVRALSKKTVADAFDQAVAAEAARPSPREISS